MIKALSLHQPYAQLIVHGAKTVDTRSWSTKYRGPLAIHAAKRPMGPEGLGLLVDNGFNPMESLMMCARNANVQNRFLGVVVATCELLDVVPMVPVVTIGEYPKVGEERVVQVGTDPQGKTCAELMRRGYWGGEILDHLTPQVPFGDYRPGRYAWLLGNVKVFDHPIPAKGRQQLWDWDEGELASCA